MTAFALPPCGHFFAMVVAAKELKLFRFYLLADFKCLVILDQWLLFTTDLCKLRCMEYSSRIPRTSATSRLAARRHFLISNMAIETVTFFFIMLKILRAFWSVQIEKKQCEISAKTSHKFCLNVKTCILFCFTICNKNRT